MKRITPKEWHERHLADIDKAKIIEHLQNGREDEVTKVSVILARQCILFVHFQKLWEMRVANLDERLSTENYMRNIYMNKNSLYKTLIKLAPN